MSKAIETVYIEAAGDPSVGIPRSSYEAQVYIERDDAEFIEEIRAAFKSLYSQMAGESVGVMFDFELDALDAAYAKMEDNSP